MLVLGINFNEKGKRKSFKSNFSNNRQEYCGLIVFYESREFCTVSWTSQKETERLVAGAHEKMLRE